MKVRIVNNNGRGRDTFITDTDTGERIPGIYAATIHCESNQRVTAELTFCIPEIDVFAIAKLSEKTKQDMRNLYEVLRSIERMEEALMEEYGLDGPNDKKVTWEEHIAKKRMEGEELRLGNPTANNNELKGKIVNGFELADLKQENDKIEAIDVTEVRDDTFYYKIMKC